MADGQTKALSLIAAYPFGIAHGLAQEISEIRNMAIDGIQSTSPVRRGHIAYLFREHGLLDEFIAKHWSFGATPEGQTKLRFYEKRRQKHLALLGGVDQDDSTDVEGDETPDSGEQEEQQAQSFALEANLRDFLANNLTVLEPGLKLYADGTHNGIEYPIDHGQIDILATDKNERPVVIELKLARGRSKALGQLIYYMGWVDEHLGRGSSRGVVVASEISDELVTAIRRVPGVSLFRYRISMSVEAVAIAKPTAT
jgi:hypothetical protein